VTVNGVAKAFAMTGWRIYPEFTAACTKYKDR
jgi:aspartate/methionine/tyrosine aminotransferase